MTNETFSDRLKLAMQAKQFKQVDLIRAAQRRGVKLGKSHVSQYVSGKTVPRTDILHFLADALQVDPDWLNNNNDNDSTLSDEKINGYYIGVRRVLTNLFGSRKVLAYVTTPEKDSCTRRLFFSTIFPEQLQIFCTELLLRNVA